MPERSRLARLASSDKLRFLIAGGGGTVFSYALYLGLLALATPAMPAYVAAYFAGIVFSYLINATWVFKSRVHWRSFVRYPAVYVIQATASILLFPWLLKLGIAQWLAPIIVTLVMLPVTYLLSRMIMRR